MKIRTFLQNKLWRDDAVSMMEKHGSRMHWRTLNDAEFDEQLRLKLIEEVHEVCMTSTKPDLISELGDIFEAIDALCRLHGVERQEILASQEKKRQERGGFDHRVFVEKAEHPIGSFGEQYCLADPEKYPELI